MNNLLYSNGLQESDSTRAETAETAKTPGKPPGHVRILLSEAASKAILANGEAFAIAGKSSHPEIAGRIVLHLVSIPKAQADAACEVAMGIRKAGKRIVPAAIETKPINLLNQSATPVESGVWIHV